MTLTTKILRDAVLRITEHLDSVGSGEFKIPQDFYWDIPREQKYDNHNPPTEFTVGQLTDDMDEINKLIAGKTPAVGYSLVWLGALLRAAGENARG